MANGNGDQPDSGWGSAAPQQPQQQQPQAPPQQDDSSGGGAAGFQAGENPFTPSPDLMRSTMYEESRGRANAVSPKGAIGLMQIMPATAASMGVTNPQSLFNPQVNFALGQRYMGQLLQRYHGNQFLALVAYNSGPGRVDKGQLLPQSVQYATRILQRMRQNPMQQQQPSADSQQQMQQPDQQQQQPDQNDQLARQAINQNNQEYLQARAQAQKPWYSRVAGAIESGLEGTAQAAEGPPDQQQQQAPDQQQAPPLQQPPQQYQQPPQQMMQQPPPQQQQMPPQQMQQPQQPGGWGSAAPQGQYSSPYTYAPRPNVSMRMGPLTITSPRPTAAPSQLRTQASSINQTMMMLNDLSNYYDTNIKAKGLEQQYGSAEGQSLWSDPAARIRGHLEPYRWKHGQWSQDITGSTGNPVIQEFYNRQGPLMASQLKALVGGRLGEKLMSGPLATHLPDPTQQTLPQMRQRIESMKYILPRMLTQLYNMNAAGYTEDQAMATLQSEYGPQQDQGDNAPDDQDQGQ